MTQRETVGFKVNSGEYKVMGLAPYGEQRFKDLILSTLIDLKEDGSFHLDQSYFDYCTALTMINDRFAELFSERVRRPDKDALRSFHMDIAASVQAVTDEILLRLTRSLVREYGNRNLCLAGGVALNCVANGKLLRDGMFERMWMQPAAGDAGGAIGAALAAWYFELSKLRVNDVRDGMKGAYLGPGYTQDQIEKRISIAGGLFDTVSDQELIGNALAEGKVVGWFQGRMEFGPRALDSRSIVADPRSPTMQKMLNLKVKYRESFRPFAPAVLREEVANWFELDCDSPYMLLVASVRPYLRREMSAEKNKLFGIDKLNVARSNIPAVTHVDYSARIQTVHAETNARFNALLAQFKAITGCPILVKTSFNVRDEPIVCTPEDAFRRFMGTELDTLIIGNCGLQKNMQNNDLNLDYSSGFDLD